jgi:SMC interacting uncharacterized protein involved in chromosome segregation
MFAEETENKVTELIEIEYKNACEQFGDKYNSLHEAFEVLLEEVEEVEDEMRFLKKYFRTLSNDIIQGENITSATNKMYFHSKNTMKELAQVGAVLMKIQNTISGVEK